MDFELDPATQARLEAAHDLMQRGAFADARPQLEALRADALASRDGLLFAVVSHTLARALAAQGDTHAANAAVEPGAAIVWLGPVEQARLLMAQAELAPARKALELALRADQLVTPLAERDPEVRVATLEAVVGYASAVSDDSTLRVLAQALAQQAKNAGDVLRAVAGTTIEVEALLRMGRNAEALEAARPARTHAAFLPVPERVDWGVRIGEAVGVAARRLGFLAEAVEALEAALVLAADHQAAPREALVLEHALALQAYEGATPRTHEALRRLSASPDGAIASAAKLAQAELALQSGQRVEARALLETLDPGDIQVLGARVALLVADGQAADALAMLDAWEASGKRFGEGQAIFRADALVQLGRQADALAQLDGEVQVARDRQQGLREARALRRRTRVLFALGDAEGARADARRVIALGTTASSPRDLAAGRVALAELMLHAELVDDAVLELEAGVAELKRLRAAGAEAEVQAVLDRVRGEWGTGGPS